MLTTICEKSDYNCFKNVFYVIMLSMVYKKENEKYGYD